MQRGWWILACLAMAAPATATEPTEIVLWPAGMPEPIVPAEPAERIEKGPDGTGRRFNVSKPRLFVYLPSEKTPRSGAAVVVVPGGGFTKLADEHEGSDACRWLAEQGVVAFGLAHRTPTNMHAAPHEGPVQDTQRAISEVRRRAAQYQVDPVKIGVLGFSAGGQVTLIAATNDRRYPDPAETVSHRPDFLVLLYPYRIWDPAVSGLRSDIRLDAGLPPTFIAQMGDDRGSLPQGSARLYFELISRGVPAEIHIYERGGHGFGMRSRPGATGPTDWPQRAADWLALRGYVVPKHHTTKNQ